MDRVSDLTYMFGDHVAEHPILEIDERLRDLVEHLQELSAKIYGGVDAQ